MNHVLFIHSADAQGAGEGSSPLVAALRKELGPDYAMDAPLMPSPEAPAAAAWEIALADHLSRQSTPFTLVGHSLGGSLILKYLAGHDRPRGLLGVVSIAAPFWGMPDWEIEEWALPPGFEKRLSSLDNVIVYHSEDDDGVSVSHADRYGEALPKAVVKKVNGRGHLFADGNVADIAGDIRRLFD